MPMNGLRRRVSPRCATGLRRWAFVGALGWILLFAACQPKATDLTPFGLKTAELKISNVPLTAEIADTPQASENGLMFRDSLPADRGMLFIFEQPRKATFWMRNTKIPLSIAYIDSAGKILEIKSMNPLDETIVPSSSDQIAYALEANQGWFAQHGISTGAIVYGIPRR
ncbi:MAG TPA: DUF192 domain-containing protein [Chthoniobacterales bacterium]|jgi:uncharacterized membrane protein (UPF0127 family)|nr:DUF192 domain-containing protein [Chthoniobacterales bacterium]